MSDEKETVVDNKQEEPTHEGETRRKSFVVQSSSHSNLSKQEKIELILQLKSKIDTLISNIRDSKTVCDKYDSEIQYFQEYIGGLVKK
ncbi:hypothetical protein JA1_002911 [Spathaspora sp. JA1]|nr:hypothetical protein JA1_002911 [Spathaspora sp. JA1]